jgi:hypothetical protein
MKFSKAGKIGKEIFKVDGKECSEEEYERLFAEETAKLPQVGDDASMEGNRPWAKPIKSDALAVHPAQIGEAMDRNARHGLHVDYDQNDGRPILKDRDQRRRLMEVESKAMGRKIVDHDGGYSDG